MILVQLIRIQTGVRGRNIWLADWFERGWLRGPVMEEDNPFGGPFLLIDMDGKIDDIIWPLFQSHSSKSHIAVGIT